MRRGDRRDHRPLGLTLTGVVLGILALFAPAASGYHFVMFTNIDGDEVHLSWPNSAFPVDYYLNRTPPLDFSLAQAEQATQASFQTWEDVESANITFNYAGLTDAEPFVFFDFISTLGFLSDPDLEGSGILAATNWIVGPRSGEIGESDIFFNNDFFWSVDPNGSPGTFDYQSVATHEIGHFIGLDHSDVGVSVSTGFRRQLVTGSAIMFPFSFGPGTVVGRELTVDDETGVSLLYPATGYLSSKGALAGQVTKGGEGVGFAHVVTFNPFTEQTIGAFADANGNFEVRGLSAGPHVVRVNPIDDPASPPDFGFPERSTDLDYADAIFVGRAEVTAGQTTRGINVEVQP